MKATYVFQFHTTSEVRVGNFESGGSGTNQYLGYGPKHDGVFTSKGIINNKVIYNVYYTIKNGLRYTPNSNEKSQDCALFFGGSFTFGQGLADSSTLPFYFNQFADQKYEILNYGFTGYGAHQMLAQIQTRVAKDLPGFKRKGIAIYSFIPEHIWRDAGYAIWDQYGPRYEIIGDSLKRVGIFTSLPRWIERPLAQSYIYKRLVFERKPTHHDLIRSIEIIKKSNELLQKKGICLYVFVWDRHDWIKDYFQSENDYYLFMSELKKNNIKTFFLSKTIPDFKEKINDYVLSELDGHPNALANEEIAKYLYTQLK